jgi:DHA1 family multidrug resistance protein-like MFS transporter
MKYLKIPSPVFAICLDYLITNVGYFSLIPILTIILSKTKGFSVSEMATAIFAITLSFRAAHFFVGPFLDSINVKTSIVIGAFLTGFSFMLMGYVNTLPLLIACSILAGCGSSANTLSAKTLVSKIGNQDGQSLTYFSIINIFVNIAAAIGSLIGSYLLTQNLTSYVFMITGIFYASAGLVILLMVPNNDKSQKIKKRIEFWNGYKSVISDKPYLEFLQFNFFGWFCYAQLFSTLPYYVSTYYQLEGQLGLLYTLNAVMIILLQLPMSKLVNKFVPKGKEIQQLLFSYLLFGLGFLIAGISQSFTILFLMIVFFTFAEMLFTPLVDTMLHSYAKPELHTTYFSVLVISKAFGDGFGSYFGLRLLDFWSQQNNYSLFWYSMVALVGIFSLICWFTMRQRHINTAK